MSGKYSDTKTALIDEQRIAEAVRSQLETITKQRFQVYDALLFKSQVVNGTNYIMKVHIEYEEHGYVHIKVFVSLQAGCLLPIIKLEGQQLNKTLKDPLEVF